MLKTPEKIRELQRKLYRKAKQVLKGESLRMKIIGKPYSGKPNVRFDEGEMETPDRYSSKIDACIEKFKSGSSPAPSLYSTVIRKKPCVYSVGSTH